MRLAPDRGEAADGLYQSMVPVQSVEVNMSVAPLDALRFAQRKLVRLEPLVSMGLFMEICAAIGGLVAAARADSVGLILVSAVAVAITVVAFAAWVVAANRRAEEPPPHVPWRDDDWRAFERSFWAAVEQRSKPRPERHPRRVDQ